MPPFHFFDQIRSGLKFPGLGRASRFRLHWELFTGQ